MSSPIIHRNYRRRSNFAAGKMVTLNHQLLLAAVSFAVLLVGVANAAHNVTHVLAGHPQYAQFNTFLSETKLADDINGRQSVTVLALSNSAAAAIANRPLSDIKAAVGLLVILDYFDPAKLHALPAGPTMSATLYQASGLAQGLEGFVNTSVRRGGAVCFDDAAAASPARPAATLVKPVALFPYNLSVLEVSAPIFPPSFSSRPPTASTPVNLTAVLEKGGCGIFATFLEKTGVLKTYEAAMGKGVTVFAPVDAAFKAVGAPDVGRLSSADAVVLLLYHALPEYAPAATLKSSDGRPFSTLASKGGSKYQVSATVTGDQLTIHADTTTAKVTGTLLDAPPVAVIAVDTLLLPAELFGKAPNVQPAPAPAPAPGPVSPSSPAPTHAPMPSPSPGGDATESPPSPPSGEAPSPGDGAEPPADSDEASDAVKPLGVMESVLLVLGLMWSTSPILSLL